MNKSYKTKPPFWAVCSIFRNAVLYDIIFLIDGYHFVVVLITIHLMVNKLYIIKNDY